MNAKQIYDALAALRELTSDLEEMYMISEGEVTPDTKVKEESIKALQDLLRENVDDLGRWLKSLQDREATYKAEKAAADARIKSTQKSIEYVKSLIRTVLINMGEESVKGKFYGFSQFDSMTSKVNMEALEDMYLDMVTEAARNAGLPSSIDVALKTNITRLIGDQMDDFVDVKFVDTVRFTKPRTIKARED